MEQIRKTSLTQVWKLQRSPRDNYVFLVPFYYSGEIVQCYPLTLLTINCSQAHWQHLTMVSTIFFLEHPSSPLLISQYCYLAFIQHPALVFSLHSVLCEGPWSMIKISLWSNLSSKVDYVEKRSYTTSDVCLFIVPIPVYLSNNIFFPGLSYNTKGSILLT